MKLLSTLFIISICMSLTIQLNAAAIGARENEEFHEQQFLFILEEVYSQDKGEWQITFDSQYLDGKKSREVEYRGAIHVFVFIEASL